MSKWIKMENILPEETKPVLHGGDVGEYIMSLKRFILYLVVSTIFTMIFIESAHYFQLNTRNYYFALLIAFSVSNSCLWYWIIL